MNLPNKLTTSRIVMIPFFVALLFVQNMTGSLPAVAVCRWLALLVFIAAALTDYYDGMIARRDNLVTNFGRLFDPLADKLLTMAAFVSFVELRVPEGRSILPAWAIIVILGREFLVTGLRSLATMQGRVIQADRWGKHKTVWQLICIITILTALCLRDSLRLAAVDIRLVDLALPWVFGVLLAVVVFFTVFSGMVYLVQNRDLITDRE